MGWMFRGDAKLARERGLAGVSFWRDGTFVLGERGIGADARFGWMGGLTGLLFWGGRGIGAGRDSAGCVFRVCGSNDLRYKPVRVSQAELVRPLASPTN